MMTLRKKKKWSIQIYWPFIGNRMGRLYIEANFRLVFGSDLFAFEIFGFGFGVMR
jgi:hypothetical protein